MSEERALCLRMIESLTEAFPDHKVDVDLIEWRSKIEARLATFVPQERHWVAVFPVETAAPEIVAEMAEIISGKITEHRMDHLLRRDAGGEV
jgi:hypothetical protein